MTRRPVEMPEYGAMVRRMVRAYGARFGEHGDVEDLLGLYRLLDDVNEALRDAVAQLMERDPEMSWARVGRAVGLSGEGARKRWVGESFPNGFVVYGLRAAGDREYRYVGQSMRVALRIAGYRHASSRETNEAFTRWLHGEGQGFEVDILGRYTEQADVDRAEKAFIAQFRADGHRLFNVSAGGRRTDPLKERCEQTEMRARGERHVMPAPVRCVLAAGHEGPCVNHGKEFGHAEEGVRKALARMAKYRREAA